MNVLAQIKNEITAYKNSTVEICDGYSYSQSKVVRRIMLYKNQIYPKGKFDSQGNYKYWFDIISPRRDNEIKNIDFDTKDITLVSEPMKDAGKLLIANARLKDFLHESGQAEKLNEAIERGTEWGNVVWKSIKDGYKLMDLNNFFVLNQKAETLEHSDVIEAEILDSGEMRKKVDVWENVEDLIKSAKPNDEKSSPEFYIYERNGEITEKDFYETKGKIEKGDETKYVLAKVIVGGIEKESPTEVLFSEIIDEKPYKEYHRGTYSGKWLRQGMYEILFDVQTRANEIGNQIARGLEWAAKTIFRSSDRIIAQNILTDLQNGDIIKSTDLTQVNTRMNSIDQLIADWNRLMGVADKLANSFEVVSGENMPAGTPFALGQLLNVNANKLFDFIREKFSIVFQDVLEEWVIPDLLKDLKARDVIKLTQDSEILNRYYQMLVEEWYVNNLIILPPHTPEIATLLKQSKLQELLKNKEVVVSLEKGMWKDFLPRVKVVITGENYALASELETLKTFIQLEQDPIRRTALIEMAMAKKNMDVERLSKSSPEQMAPKAAQQLSQQALSAFSAQPA